MHQPHVQRFGRERGEPVLDPLSHLSETRGDSGHYGRGMSMFSNTDSQIEVIQATTVAASLYMQIWTVRSPSPTGSRTLPRRPR